MSERAPRAESKEIRSKGRLWLVLITGLLSLVALMYGVYPSAANAGAPTSTIQNRHPDAPQNTATPTPTPSQPVLLSVGLSPNVASPGSTIVMTFTLFSPDVRQVSLGAGVRVNGTYN